MSGLEKKTETHSVLLIRPFDTAPHQGRLFGTDAVFFSAGHAIFHARLSTPGLCLSAALGRPRSGDSGSRFHFQPQIMEFQILQVMAGRTGGLFLHQEVEPVLAFANQSR